MIKYLQAWLFSVSLVTLLILCIGTSRAEAAASTCTLATSGISFSAYDPVTKAAQTSSGTVTVTCTGSGQDTLTLELSGGNTNSCTTPRQMRQGTHSLSYQVFTDSAGSNPWCTGTGPIMVPLDFRGSPGSTRTVTHDFYGRVAANQTPTASGRYTDALTATLRQGTTVVATSAVMASGAVSASCSLAATSLGFGVYDPSATGNSSGDLSINCTMGISYKVGLGPGANATATSRRMGGPNGSFLIYQLFSESSHAVAWGDGTNFGATVDRIGSGSNQTVPVYGRIPSGQNVHPGSYSDTVTVTVDY